MPELVELQSELGRGVRFEAVSIDLADPVQVKTAEELGAFMEHRNLRLPVVAFSGDWDALTTRLDIPAGPPITVAFDREGHEVGRIEGAAGKSEIQQLIETALAR